MFTCSACCATRADRFAERTDANVATASTKVPTPVASEETVVQLIISSPPYRCTAWPSHGPGSFLRDRQQAASMVDARLTHDVYLLISLIILAARLSEVTSVGNGSREFVLDDAGASADEILAKAAADAGNAASGDLQWQHAAQLAPAAGPGSTPLTGGYTGPA